MSYVAFQYAEALFSLSVDEKQLEDVYKAFNAFTQAQDKDIYSFLNHPKVSKNQKKEVLSKAIDNTLVKNFMNVLIDNSRIELLEDCFNEFKTIYNNQHKAMSAFVYSGVALEDSEMKQLQDNLGKKHNRNVTLENVVDPSILGGIKIEFEGNVLDQTINHYLHTLKSSLTK
jgi:F-type H+-transporting ATPase subunit delta